MKTKMIISTILGLFSIALFSLPASLEAQIITYVGTTSGSTMPGSPTDWVFFNTTTFVDNQTQSFTAPGTGSGEDLTSFSTFGGVQSDNGSSSNYSSIIPPGGSSALLTGNVNAVTSNSLFGGYNNGGGEITIGLEPTGNTANFNYNDFNVYVMISNLNTLTDAEVLLSNSTDMNFSSTSNTDAVVGVTDANTDLSTAQYIEFNVHGFGSYLEAGNYLVLGTQSSVDNAAYIGGVSFESLPVPEPSIFVIILGSLGMLFLTMRHREAAFFN